MIRLWIPCCWWDIVWAARLPCGWRLRSPDWCLAWWWWGYCAGSLPNNRFEAIFAALPMIEVESLESRAGGPCVDSCCC